LSLRYENTNCKYQAEIILETEASSGQSDLSKVLERNDIFIRKIAISGLKSIPWAGLDKLVNTHLDSSIFAGIQG
jgi:hypothetical protein